MSSPAGSVGRAVSGDDGHGDEHCAYRRVTVTRFDDGVATAAEDRVAHEEPLEIRVNGVPIAVVMRTPGHDEELALGFLLGERVVDSAADVVSLKHCTTVDDPEAEGNVLNVVLGDHVVIPFERLRRNTYASSSCGLCGKATIRAALIALNPVQSSIRITPRAIAAMPAALRGAQPSFELTGGLHAAALFTPAGELCIAHEDVGRHNAVDKVFGAAACRALSTRALVLFVSGRISLEIVQKAVASGTPLVAGISAPTSLAIRYASALGVTVAGFVRGDRLNLYSHAERVCSA